MNQSLNLNETNETAEILHSVRPRNLISCPHCNGPTKIRSSRHVAPTYKQLYFICQNELCEHKFGAELSITHTISPSLQPNPAVHLRLSPPRMRSDCRRVEPGGEGAEALPANDNPHHASGGSEVPPARAASTG